MIQLTDITKTVRQGGETQSILQSIDLEVKSGEFISLMGPSGSGKSTLLNILGLLDTPTTGKYLFEGKDITRLSSNQQAVFRNQKIGFVFQSFMLIPRLSVAENVEVPLIYTGLNRKKRKDLVHQALEQVGMLEKAKQSVVNLSGGQKQKVAIARAISQKPEVLLADEPTGNLDSKSKEDILHIFHQLHQQGKTIILVTHDYEIGEMAQRQLSLRNGQWWDSPMSLKAGGMS